MEKTAAKEQLIRWLISTTIHQVAITDKIILTEEAAFSLVSEIVLGNYPYCLNAFLNRIKTVELPRWKSDTGIDRHMINDEKSI